MDPIINDIKRTFTGGGMLVRLIYVNLAVFIVSVIAGIITSLTEVGGYNFMVDFFAVPSHPSYLIVRPWTVITYMFLHVEFMHILFNMLVLFWFGKIFLHFINQKHLLGLYLLGGLSGALIYILAYNLISPLSEYHGVALGASASVMAVVFATTTYAPDFEVYLLFLGRVKIKYIALATVILDIFGILANDNVGGHIAHFGGAIYGFIYMSKFKEKKDIAAGFNSFIYNIPNWFRADKTKKKKFKVSHKNTPTNASKMSDYEYNKQKNISQEEVDRILDKISKSGYESLTKEEKDKLFGMSNKL